MQQEGDGEERESCTLTSEIFKQACHSGELVKFWFMPGRLRPNFLDARGYSEIQPQLPAPLPFNVKIINYCSESHHGNRQGIALLAEVKEVPRYESNLPNLPLDDYAAPVVLKPGDILRISYHLLQSTGGFSILLRGDDPILKQCCTTCLTDVAPTVNSLSQLCREYIGKSSMPQPTDRNRRMSAPRRSSSVYKVASTSAGRPVGHAMPLDITCGN